MSGMNARHVSSEDTLGTIEIILKSETIARKLISFVIL